MITFLLYFILPLLGVLTAISIVVIVSHIKYGKEETLYDKPITLPQLSTTQGREKEIRRIARQIMTGQSSAIIGPFSAERTSILETLNNPELYGDKADRLIFSYLDISSLDKDCSQPGAILGRRFKTTSSPNW
jgi:hypothetical protein